MSKKNVRAFTPDDLSEFRMIEPKLLAVLRCPVTGEGLELAEKKLIERLNAAIQRGALRDGQDQKITQLIEAGLVTGKGDRLYPIRGSIPIMIADESIELVQLHD